MNEVYVRGGFVTLLLVLTALIYLFPQGITLGDTQLGGSFSMFDPGCPEERLCVSFLDVGQGDATYIESPTGVQVIVDGGPGSSVLRALSREMDFFDKTIDVVVATHPDADHIGGLVDVLARYEVGTVVMTENGHDTPVADAFRTGVEREGAEVVLARRGQLIEIGGGAVLEILFPDRDVSEVESNTSSIVMRLRYGAHDVMLMGDAPEAIEEYLLLLDGLALQSEVLKVGHHGSDTSSGEVFIETVAPRFAVISAGADNRYGHPHAEVIETLETVPNISILETAEEGTITLISDGERLRVE